VAESLPVDQYYVKNPDELFGKPTEDLMIDLESKVIVEAHLQCAGQEMPLSLDDEIYFGPLTRELCETRLIKDKDGWSVIPVFLVIERKQFVSNRYHTHPKFLPFPSRYVAIRGGEEEKYVAVDVTRAGQPGAPTNILEEIEISRALFEIYEGAVASHLHTPLHKNLVITYSLVHSSRSDFCCEPCSAGSVGVVIDPIQVKEVSHDSKIAKLIRADVNWITKPRYILHFSFCCQADLALGISRKTWCFRMAS
jgi:DEAD/DEAH box helicase domain-containing protein